MGSLKRDIEDLEIGISNEVDRVIKINYENANRIISSQDHGADKIETGLANVTDGIEGIYSILDWGFSELIWQVEQTREVVKEILSVLQAPLGTEAKELKARADEAYRNGLLFDESFIDDAEDDYLESEKKNRYDFSIHISLGFIYYKHKNKPKKALEYFNKAEKYATPKSYSIASYALMHQGKIYYDQKNYQKAYELALKGLELKPDYFELHYRIAQYCACLNRFDEAIDHLKTAINGNRYFCLDADNDENFGKMKKQLNSLFEALKRNAHSQAKHELNDGVRMIKEFYSYGVSQSSLRATEELLERAKSCFAKDEYLAYMHTIDIAKEVKTDAVNSSEIDLNVQIHKLENALKEMENKFNNLKNYSKFGKLYRHAIGFLVIFTIGIILWAYQGVMTPIIYSIPIIIIAPIIIISYFVYMGGAKHRFVLKTNKAKDKLRTLKDYYSRVKRYQMNIMTVIKESSSKAVKPEANKESEADKKIKILESM
jgi:tetratricopeptide (TPR) repeat protein